MPGWTGHTKWVSRNASDTRSNGEWSLQIFYHPSGSTAGNALYMGRINGPYKGVGIMYWFNRARETVPLKTFVCYERTSDGIIFDGKDGDYCHKILGGVKYQERHYTLSY